MVRFFLRNKILKTNAARLLERLADIFLWLRFDLRTTCIEALGNNSHGRCPVFTLTCSVALFQATQLYAPHLAGYPQVSPPTSLQYMSEPSAVLGSSVTVSVLKKS